MPSQAIHTPNPVAQAILVLVGEEPAGHQVSVPSAHPTGAEILQAAGRPASPNQIVLQVLHAGGMESIRLEERADLAAGSTFVLSTGDKTFRYTVDLAQFEWPHRLISAGTVRRVANVASNHLLALARSGGAQLLDEQDVVDLADAGVEKFVTLPPVAQHIWKLNIQGVVLEYNDPHVRVADAMTQAGFDPKKAWHIYLIVHGQPKKEVDSSFVVDLRTPGIEKIRLMQRNVDNGDGQASAQRGPFKLLAADTDYLDTLGLRWETVMEANRRWLLIHDYPVPQGFVPARTVLALDIPATTQRLRSTCSISRPSSPDTIVATSTERRCGPASPAWNTKAGLVIATRPALGIRPATVCERTSPSLRAAWPRRWVNELQYHSEADRRHPRRAAGSPVSR